MIRILLVLIGTQALVLHDNRTWISTSLLEIIPVIMEMGHMPLSYYHAFGYTQGNEESKLEHLQIKGAYKVYDSR